MISAKQPVDNTDALHEIERLEEIIHEYEHEIHEYEHEIDEYEHELSESNTRIQRYKTRLSESSAQLFIKTIAGIGLTAAFIALFSYPIMDLKGRYDHRANVKTLKEQQATEELHLSTWEAVNNQTETILKD